MTDPTPREAANAVELHFLGRSSPVVRELMLLVRHARATTPSDDRGRELAEVRERHDGVEVHGQPSQSSRDIASLLAEVDRLRALADPADTEPGQRVQLVVREAVRRVRASLADLDDGMTVPTIGVGQLRGLIDSLDVALAAAPPPPEGEAGSIVVEFIGGPTDRWHTWAVRPDTEGAAEVVRTLLPRVHAVRVHRGECGGTEPRNAT